MNLEILKNKCDDCPAERTCNEALYDNHIIPTCPQFKNKQVLTAEDAEKLISILEELEKNNE